MKKAFYIITVILFLLLLNLIFDSIVNEYAILKYKQKAYDDDLISLLEFANWHEPYIVYYNKGNILHMKKQYDKAIESYEKALDKNPPLEKKCDIRINMTLSMTERAKKKKKKEYIKALEEAKKNLYNDHCADEQDDSGESEEAEQLEQEINKEIQNASSQQGNNQGNGQGNSGEDESDESGNSEDSDETEEMEPETEEEKNIESQLEEINKDATLSKQKDLQTYEHLGDYDYYSGKNW